MTGDGACASRDSSKSLFPVGLSLVTDYHRLRDNFPGHLRRVYLDDKIARRGIDTSKVVPGCGAPTEISRRATGPTAPWLPFFIYIRRDIYIRGDTHVRRDFQGEFGKEGGREREEESKIARVLEYTDDGDRRRT